MAAAARWALDPLLGDSSWFVTFYVAVAIAAWIGGLRGSLLATALGFFTADYLFVPPRFDFFGEMTMQHFLALVLYLMVSLAFAVFGEAMWRARRRAEEGRETLAATLASIGDGVIATDTAGRVTLLNRVAEELTGSSLAEASGRPLVDVFRIVNEDTRAEVGNPALRALKEGMIVGLANHTVLLSKRGEERPIDDSAAPIRDRQGKTFGAVLVFRDITERKRTEAALRKWEFIVNHAGWAVAVAHPETHVLEMVNPAFAAMHGYSVDEIVGRPLADTFAPESRAELLEHARIAHEKGDHVYEAMHIRKDGTTVPVLTHVSALKTKNGRVLHRAATFQDMTERRRAEARQALLVQELSHRVKNTLANVQAIAVHSLHHVPAEAKEAFLSRLHALAHCHNLLTGGEWQSASLRDVLDGTFAPHEATAMPARVVLDGEDIRLSPRDTVTLALAAHELATNAAKHGALSNDTGEVRLSWRMRRDGAAPLLRLDWSEHNGPRIEPPSRQGFGSRLLKSLTGQEGASYESEFAPAGFRCSLELPLEGADP